MSWRSSFGGTSGPSDRYAKTSRRWSGMMPPSPPPPPPVVGRFTTPQDTTTTTTNNNNTNKSTDSTTTTNHNNTQRHHWKRQHQAGAHKRKIPKKKTISPTAIGGPGLKSNIKKIILLRDRKNKKSLYIL